MVVVTGVREEGHRYHVMCLWTAHLLYRSSWVNVVMELDNLEEVVDLSVL